MMDRAAAVWASNPKRYVRATGEVLDEDAGWDGDGSRRAAAVFRTSYLVPNDPALIDALPTAHRLFVGFGVNGATPPEGQGATVTARAANLYRELLRSFDDAARARLGNDSQGFLIAMSRSFSVIQAIHQFAAHRTVERAAIERAAAEHAAAERAAAERAVAVQAATGPAGVPYVARAGFTVSTAFTLFGSAGFVLLGLLLPYEQAGPISLIIVVFFGACGLLSLLDLALRRVRLRVDAEGVTLGGPLLNYRRSTKRLTWSEVRRVVLFRGIGVITCVGVEPWTGAGVRKPLSMSDELNQLMAPHVPAAVVRHSVMVHGWRLDRDRLVAAVRDFAPSVEIVEAG
ncbi:hypothetical protein [Microlunatus speluncae]|uniref:hypothetical protein n=1 Tax=Microlunatus speluncae TaxID=2594267 RepID=UPI001C2D9579|nr:hypothetical protein [Microlunatus speluncae]